MAMKVFNLQCEHGHDFEGWFASEDDYRQQTERGLLECPMCGSATVRRMPAAPRLNLSSAQRPGASRGAEPADDARKPDADVPPSAVPQPGQLQQMWLQMARQIMANTEDVGDRFAEEARRIHYNEAPERGIRGVASREETRELADEGIEVFSFPLPQAAKKRLQ